MKKGFTLSEMLITLGLLGVIAAILIPTLKNATPNKDLLMFRKVFSITERVVSELVNDEDLYPEMQVPLRGHYLANTVRVNYHKNTFEGNTKFAGLFIARLSTLGESPKDGVYTTPDGVKWYLPITSFRSNDEENPVSNNARIILVDINGDKEPNCYYDSVNACNNKPDRFKIKIYSDGRLEPGGCMEKEYLQRKSTSSGAEISVIDTDHLDACKADGDVENEEWQFDSYFN